MTAPPPTKTSGDIKGNGKGVIVKQSMSWLYCISGDEALHKLIDTHFEDYEWVLLQTYDNTENDESKTYTCHIDPERTITSGSDVNKHYDFVSEVNSLQIKYDDTTKIFVDDETKDSTRTDVEVKVAAKSKVYIYQKRYHFTAKVWFILDAWGSLWTVGNWKSSGVAEKTGTYYVDSNEHEVRESKPTDTKDLSVTEGTIEKRQGDNKIKKFEDCTSKCQDYVNNGKSDY